MGRLLDENELLQRLGDLQREHYVFDSVDEAEIIGLITSAPTAAGVANKDVVIESLERYLFEKYCIESDPEIARIINGEVGRYEII